MKSLSGKNDFLALRNKGRRRIPVPWLVIYFKKNDRECVRWGCTISRHIGNAVTRNRLRRWSREYLRGWAKNLEKDQNVDISLVFRQNKEKDFFRHLKHEDLDAALKASLDRT